MTFTREDWLKIQDGTKTALFLIEEASTPAHDAGDFVDAACPENGACGRIRILSVTARRLDELSDAEARRLGHGNRHLFLEWWDRQVSLPPRSENPGGYFYRFKTVD